MGDIINKDFNLFLFIQLLIMLIGITWMTLWDIDVGDKYLTMFLVSIAVLFLAFLFTREGSSKGIFNSIKVPFSVSYVGASSLYILGWIIPIILGVLGANTSKVMAPLAASELQSQVSLSFQQLSISSDAFFQFFITVWTAGTLEEFVFGFSAMVAGGLVAYALVQSKMVNFGPGGNRWFYFSGGMIFSVATFMMVHQLNDSYNSVGFFIAAGLFRLVLNTSIYWLGLALSFTIGFHQANNAVYYYTAFGKDSVLNALMSTGGIIILLFMMLTVAYVLFNLRDAGRFFKLLGRDMRKAVKR